MSRCPECGRTDCFGHWSEAVPAFGPAPADGSSVFKNYRAYGADGLPLTAGPPQGAPCSFLTGTEHKKLPRDIAYEDIAKYKVWIECGDVILETDDLATAIAECKLYEADGAYITDANDRCI